MKDSSTKRISGYGVAIAAVLGTTSADAAITFVDINPDATGSSTNNISLLSFNLAGDVATNGTSVANEQFFARHTYNTSTNSPASSKLTFGTTNGIAAFDPNPQAYGTTIGPGQTVDPASTSATLTGFVIKGKGSWTPGQTAYLALKFNNAGVANYGWAQITAVNNQTITLLGFAYDDQGNPVAAGSLEPVPEPTQIALFALGAAGVAAFRRRKAVSTTKK